jgi:hypothetical protein
MARSRPQGVAALEEGRDLLDARAFEAHAIGAAYDVLARGAQELVARRELMGLERVFHQRERAVLDKAERVRRGPDDLLRIGVEEDVALVGELQPKKVAAGDLRGDALLDRAPGRSRRARFGGGRRRCRSASSEASPTRHRSRSGSASFRTDRGTCSPHARRRLRSPACASTPHRGGTRWPHRVKPAPLPDSPRRWCTGYCRAARGA